MKKEILKEMIESIVKRDLVRYLIIGVIGLVLVSMLLIFRGGLTGYAIFEDSGTDFDNGVYNNTEYNGSSVVLSEDNLTGDYVSQVFDAGADANWNNLTYGGEVISGYDSFLTSAIHLGLNRNEVFVLDGVYYLVDMKDESKRCYLNFSNNLLNNAILKFYAKQEKGVGIGIYAESDESGSNALGSFIVDSETGDWYNVSLSLSSVTNAIWIGEGSGSGIDPKDYFDYIYAEIPDTTLSFQVKNCSESDCSDASWETVDLDDLSLISRYFQYKAIFTSPDSSISSYLSSVSLDYDLINTAPVISLTSPEGVYDYNTSLNLNFSVFDNDGNLDSCWYNLDNGGNISVASCANTTFDVAEGSYTLNIYANDSLGLVGSDNSDFIVAVNSIILSLTSPSGEYTSRTDIPITYTVAGTNLTCWYNVEFAIGGEVISNTSLENCSDSNLDVSVDGNYILNLYANNSLEILTSDNSSFSVDTSTAPIIPSDDSPSSGGSSSSSSSTVPSTSSINLEVTKIGNIVSYAGEQKTLLLNVKNKIFTFLNNCKLTADGEISSWIYSTQVKGIALGESVDFEFDLNVPEGTEAGDYLGELIVKCDEGENKQDIIVSIPGLNLIEIKEVLLEKDELIINYVFDNSKGIEEEISVDIWIVNRDNIEIKRIKDSFILEKGIVERQVLMKLPKNLAGVYSIYFALSSDLDNFVKDSVILGKSRTIGMVVLDTAKGKFGVYVVFLIIMAVVVYFIWKRHKEKNPHTQKNKHGWLIRKKKKF